MVRGCKTLNKGAVKSLFCRCVLQRSELGRVNLTRYLHLHYIVPSDGQACNCITPFWAFRARLSILCFHLFILCSFPLSLCCSICPLYVIIFDCTSLCPSFGLPIAQETTALYTLLNHLSRFLSNALLQSVRFPLKRKEHLQASSLSVAVSYH